MNCTYCQQEMKEQRRSHCSRSKIEELRHYCQNCGATFRCLPGGEINYITWMTIVNNKKYSIRVSPDRTNENGKSARNFLVYYVGEVTDDDTADAKFAREEIMVFDFVPDWTPQNIQQKLATHLLFL